MRAIAILLLLTTSAYAEEPTYRAQSDRRLSKQPFTSAGRVLEFYSHGMYRLSGMPDGKEIQHGAYNLFGNALVLDPDAERKVTCRYSVDQYDDLRLDDCAYVGTWKSPRFK
jgi:hypothetical protein